MFNFINNRYNLLCSLFFASLLFIPPTLSIAKQQTALLDTNGQPLTAEVLNLLSSGASVLNIPTPQKKIEPTTQGLPKQNLQIQKLPSKNSKKSGNKYRNSNPELQEELINALKDGRTARAMNLVKSGVNPNYKNNNGETALAVAVKKAWATMVRELCEKGANVHQKNPNGVTLLHDASSRGLTDVAKLLIKYGANPAKRTDKNWTSLHVAARYGHWELVRLYVQMGVDPDIRNSDGKTALELAQQLRHQGPIQILSRVTRARPLPIGLIKKSKRSKRKSRKKKK